MLRCRIDHSAGDAAGSVELIGPLERFEARRVEDVAATIRAAEDAAANGAFVAGFVAYDAAPAFEPAAATPGRGGAIPLAWFASFAEQRSAAPLRRCTESASAWTAEVDERSHAGSVAAIQEAIGEGNAYLVNLTTRMRRRWETGEEAIELYERLVSGYDAGYHAFIETDRWAVACGSPELFFERVGRRVTTRPMKGTSARGRWSEEDDALAEQLATSGKERAENVMVVDLLRNDLGRIARPGSVEVPALAELERHPALWQLTSTVTAELEPDLGLDEVFEALFPCASVTGAPKIASMGIIAELEGSARGLYCGAVGTITPGELAPEARFAVAIRSAVVDKAAGEVVYGSGGGITADSDPAAEWRELQLKAAALEGPTPRRLLPELGLIETMGFDPGRGEGVGNLDGHLARLEASARYLGLEVPEGLRGRIEAAVAGLDRPQRLRLVLHRGGVELELEEVQAAGVDPISLCLDLEPVRSDDPGLFHKTTERSRYELRAARHPHADDVVLVNERGEVTETTRANLAVLLDGVWCTPPLCSGVLPGVERARRIADGELVERVISVDDLRAAESVATLSSLRGWRVASLAASCGGR